MRKLPGKIAAINDLAGYGRCSLAVMLPVISACGYQCCPMPTAVLSSSNDFAGPFVRELTDEMPRYMDHWENLGLAFDGIYSGYLSSPEQMDSVQRFVTAFRKPDTVVLVDPVFGDHGRASPRCNADLLRRYRELLRQADMITPNLTEACYLADRPFEEDLAEASIDEVGRRLQAIGPRHVILTGIRRGDRCCTYLYTEEEKHIVSAPYCTQERTGAGDLFASILLSKYLDGCTLVEAAEQAAEFLSRVLQYTYEQRVPQNQGICFEPFLGQLVPGNDAETKKE